MNETLGIVCNSAEVDASLFLVSTSTVSQYMDGRSHSQCYKRFCKIDPNKNTGHWTETEDAVS